jgi:glucose/arabinose dehydrogenase
LASWTIVHAVFAGIAAVTAQQAAPAAGQQPPAGQGAPAGEGRGGRGGGRGAAPAPVDTLGAGPWEFGGGRGGGRYRVSVVTRGVDRPWGIAFLPDGDMLVTERGGRLRVIRKGVLDPTPIGPLPAMAAEGLGGLLDVTLHPNFAENRLIYLAYSKPGPTWGQEAAPAAAPAQAPAAGGRGNAPRRSQEATTAVYRARWDGGSTLADGKDVWVADAWHGGLNHPQGIGPATGSYGTRIVFAKDGTMFVSLGDRNYPPAAQDTNSHIGKIVRLRDDGSVPPDNPFVGKAGYKPEIYTLGHRNPLGLYLNPANGQLWSTEQGPQGGDELNLIQAGKNYGWPIVSLGRNYDGTVVGKGFTAPGLEEPVVFWVPAIAVSGLSFYNGDKFPNWRGNAFVGGMRNNTGQHIQRVQFNAKGEPTGRELMLGDLRQRIREVKPGPDGNIYVLTDEPLGAVLKIEPAQ